MAYNPKAEFLEPTQEGQTPSASKLLLGQQKNNDHSPPLEEILQLVPACRTPVRVLVAEDNAMTRLCLSNLLSRLEVSFVICKDGKEAWHELSTDVFDLALIDLQMPYLDGSKLVERLRKSANNADIPVVALTGSADPQVLKELSEVGINDCLIKPFAAGDFFRVIRQYTTLHTQQPIHFFAEIFDDQLLLQLYDNDYEHISFMFSLFLTNTPKSVASIQAAVAAQDWDVAQREVHKVKPTFAMVGLQEAGKLASRLENKLHPKAMGKGLQLELKCFYQKVEDALQAVASEKGRLFNYLK